MRIDTYDFIEKNLKIKIFFANEFNIKKFTSSIVHKSIFNLDID